MTAVGTALQKGTTGDVASPALKALMDPPAFAALSRHFAEMDKVRKIAMGDGALQLFLESQSAAARLAASTTSELIGSVASQLSAAERLANLTGASSITKALSQHPALQTDAYELFIESQPNWVAALSKQVQVPSFDIPGYRPAFPGTGMPAVLEGLTAAAGRMEARSPFADLDAKLVKRFAPPTIPAWFVTPTAVPADLWDPGDTLPEAADASFRLASSEEEAVAVVEVSDLMEELEFLLPATVTGFGRAGLQVVFRMSLMIEANIAYNFVELAEFDSLIGPRCDDAIWPHLLSGSVAVTI